MGFLKDLIGRVSNLTIADKTIVNKGKDALDSLKLLRASQRPVVNDPYLAHDYKPLGFNYLNTLVTEVDLVQMALYSDILRNVIITLKQEIFREGFEITPCRENASETQKDRIDTMIKSINHNRQSLREVLSELEEDLDVLDNAYLLVSKDYFLDDNGRIVGSEVDEVIRLDPLCTQKVMDRKFQIGYNQNGEKLYFNIRNRGVATTEPFDENGNPNLRACYKVSCFSGNQGNDPNVVYYDSSEVLHVSKYRPSKGYGFSNLFSLFQKVSILINQDLYVRQYYSGQKVPKGVFHVQTTNPESFFAAWSEWLARTRRNPHEVNPILTRGKENENIMQFINFMNNLQEMQFVEARRELREAIGAMYFVSPIFMNDLTGGGGLNNEGLQITVTNRGIELGQSIFNEKVLPFIFETNFGITDWDVKLKSSRELDQVAEKELRLKELDIVRRYLEMGLDVSMDKDGVFHVKEGTLALQQPGMGGNLLDSIGGDSGIEGTDSQPEAEPIELGDSAVTSSTTGVYNRVNSEEEVEKATYQGKQVKLNKPFRLPSGSSKKFGVYVKDGDKVKRVTFGDPTMEIKRDDPKARAAFRSRHKCDLQKDKTKPSYWSCRMWDDESVSDLLD